MDIISGLTDFFSRAWFYFVQSFRKKTHWLYRLGCKIRNRLFVPYCIVNEIKNLNKLFFFMFFLSIILFSICVAYGPHDLVTNLYTPTEMIAFVFANLFGFYCLFYIIFIIVILMIASKKRDNSSFSIELGSSLLVSLISLTIFIVVVVISKNPTIIYLFAIITFISIIIFTTICLVVNKKINCQYIATYSQ